MYMQIFFREARDAEVLVWYFWRPIRSREVQGGGQSHREWTENCQRKMAEMWNSYPVWTYHENSERYYDHVRVWALRHQGMLLVNSFGGKIFMYRTSQVAMWSKHCFHLRSSFDTAGRHKKLVYSEEISHVSHGVLQELSLHHHSQNVVLRL